MKMIEYILSYKQIKNRYINDDNLLFRMIFWLFAYSGKEDTIHYVLSELKISDEKIKALMNYQYPAPLRKFGKDAWEYHRYTIMDQVVSRNTLNALKTLVSFIGEQSCIDNIFINNDWNILPLETAIQKNKMKMIEYILSYNQIKNRYIND